MWYCPARLPRLAAKVRAAAFTVLAVGVIAPAAQAQSAFLVGAYLYSANSTGATVGQGFQYDTNSNDIAAFLQVNGAGGSPKNIALSVTNNTVNNFTLQSASSSSLIGSNAALGLFFASTATSYNPSPAGSARTPDLLVSVANGSAAFFVPVAGTVINDYAFAPALSETANGLSQFTINGVTLSVSAFTATNGPNSTVNGRFSLTSSIASAPEPGSVALLGIGLLGIAGVARRRRGTL